MRFTITDNKTKISHTIVAKREVAKTTAKDDAEKVTKKVADAEKQELSEEEMKSLKQLAAKVPELLDLLESAKKSKETEVVEETEKESEDEEVEEVEENNLEESEDDAGDETGLEDSDDAQIHDSYGSVEVQDSNNDNSENELDIDDAWQKHYDEQLRKGE